MTRADQAVGCTADGLVVLRAGALAKQAGLHDPHAAWFVTDAGRRLADMALSVDPVYEAFNLARFLHTSGRLTRWAESVEQAVFLGAGFDSRALWLPGFREGRVTVYEVDTPDKLEQKREALRQHGVSFPGWIRSVACDLRDDALREKLFAAGLDPAQPALVLAEGITFYLPPAATLRLLDPSWLRLAGGSAILFDAWAAPRVQGLNERVTRRLGHGLFQEFPFPVDDEHLVMGLNQLGYSRVQATPLQSMAEQALHRVPADGFPLGWWLAEAVL